jgi:hypothetical protein
MEYIILDDLFGVKLWGENIFRRFYHHFQNCEYNINKIPYLYTINNLLSANNINIIKSILLSSNITTNSNNISPLLSYLVGGNYSKRCTLYYNNFSNNNKIILDNIGNKMKPYFEKITNKKLKLGNSDFRCVILSYEGKDSNFVWHYDTEHPQSYRTIFLFDKYGNISPFGYINKYGNKEYVSMDIGDGIFFRGTTTYHGIDKSDDINQIRRVIGWQYIEDPLLVEEKKSLCSELRSKSITTYIYILSIYIIPFMIIINLLNIKIYIQDN